LHSTLTVRQETSAVKKIDAGKSAGKLTPRPSQLYSSGVSKDKGNAARLRREDKIDLLKTVGVFQSLNSDELAVVADNAAWRDYSKGEIVFPNEAGNDSGTGRIYTVQQGEVLITKSGDEHRDIILATFVTGESFGELSLFDRGTVDTTSRCEENTTLLVFPVLQPENLQQGEGKGAEADTLFAEHPQIKAKILRTLLAIVAQRIRSTNRLIAEKSPWVQELRRQVMLDKLTGLYNASYLEEDFLRLLEQKPEGTCFLMIKPDNLKTLNDSYGHQAGDRTLQLMASELRNQLSERGIPIRYKGDVFSVILPQVGLEAARETAEQIRAGMNKIDVSEVSQGSTNPRTDLGITVSIGVSAHPNGGTSTDKLIERAYENLFTARNRGGDRICSQQRK
jgi:diguanylate cyclase (GGDEF)-like protein